MNPKVTYKTKRNIILVGIIVFFLVFTPIAQSGVEHNDVRDMNYCEFIKQIIDFFVQNPDLDLKTNTVKNTQYDLLIICPDEFSDEAQRLKVHKDSYGMKTQIKTTEEIYDDYNGFDKAEKIKYCIKDFYDTNQISYVLLLGGLKSGFGFFGDPTQENKWHVPGRYSYLDLDGFPEYRYLCDLYFADLYDSETHSIFQTWNTDEDGRDDWFGEWRWENGQEIIDQRDLIPDVAVGRIPCRKISELEIIVDKIITYESQTKGQEWFKDIILVGGDSLDDNTYQDDKIIKKGKIEGKVAGQQAFNWSLNRDSFRAVTFFPKEHSQESDIHEDIFPQNFYQALNQGCGFTYLVGHGNKGWWFNHYIHGDHQNFSYIRCSPDIYWDKMIQNGDKLPVLILDGCHLCDFSMNMDELFISKTWRCFGYVFLYLENGGSIASIGNTAVCYGAEGTDYLNMYDGCLYARFFEEYGNGTSMDCLGDYLCRVIAHYVEDPYMFGTDISIRDNILHTKCLESTVLLGDPSLMIGGY